MVARITVPDGGRLVTGTERIDLGQLAGRALKQNAVRSFSTTSDGTDDRTVAEWIVAAPAGSTCDVEVAHDRAGVVRTSVVLA
jgi:hypothetical protein